MDERSGTTPSKGTKRTDNKSDFSTTKPLPPIGSGTTEDDDDDDRLSTVSESQDSEGTKTEDIDDDDETKSTSSTTAFDRAGEGSARPRIVRGFRPEAHSDEETETKRDRRSVSFTELKDTPGSPSMKSTMRRKTYDGREITFISLNTQTDWDWVNSSDKIGAKHIFGSPRSSITEELKPTSRGTPKPESIEQPKSARDELSMEESPQVPMPYSDEFGIPILDLSSDTDDSSDEELSYRKTKDDRNFLPSVGPPQILQYQRESEKKSVDVEAPESRLPPIKDTEDFDTDHDGKTHGMYSGMCEFCKKAIKPFPTLEEQLQVNPEKLYCCQDYREFVEFVLNTTTELEQEEKKKTMRISIKPHEHVGSKQERTAAKEKAVQRMRERELQRRAQEATGIQQNFFASHISGKGFGRQSAGPVSMKEMFVARQMKTINYQLSSQKCLEEGWTLRAPSPLLDDDGNEVFVPEPLNPDLITEGRSSAFRPDSTLAKAKLRERPLIEKFYESGQKFLTMFPDGTGNIFYPSGNLAILISSVKLGQYYYTIHHDIHRSFVFASFDPTGYGYCYFPNGDVRLYIDQFGGIELDHNGGQKRKWSWKDQITHVHAPPFQPICIGLNRNMGLRVMSQENITISFSSFCRSCRFNMGCKLKLVAPENAPIKEIEEEKVFLEEKKSYVESLLDKVATLLKFPNSPKIDKILPPLHVTSKQLKSERLKQERKTLIAAQVAKDKKSQPITAN